MKLFVVLLLAALAVFATASPLMILPKFDFNEEELLKTIEQFLDQNQYPERHPAILNLRDAEEIVERLEGIPIETTTE